MFSAGPSPQSESPALCCLWSAHVTGCHSYGIPEPSLKSAKTVPTWSLDLILMPLVGFDRQGNRLGMGGGYYDRTLAFVNGGIPAAPRLVGLAHSCQEVASIPSHSWDVAVEKIITDREIICVKPK